MGSWTYEIYERRHLRPYVEICKVAQELEKKYSAVIKVKNTIDENYVSCTSITELLLHQVGARTPRSIDVLVEGTDAGKYCADTIGALFQKPTVTQDSNVARMKIKF